MKKKINVKMEQQKQLAKFIDRLLFDYDLIETDKECLHNISGALLDSALWNKRINKSLISEAIAEAHLKYGDYVEVRKALSIIASVNNN